VWLWFVEVDKPGRSGSFCVVTDLYSALNTFLY
jgi:hypothetical protein